MLLWVVIGWLVVVGAAMTLVGLRGAATYRRARTAEGALRAQVAALEQGGLVTLAERTAELQRRVEQLRAVLDRLARSLAVLRLLVAAWAKATAPALAVLRFVRR